MRRKILLAVIVVSLLTVAASSVVFAKGYADDLAEQKTKYDNSQTELRKTYQELESLDDRLQKEKEEHQTKDATSQEKIQKLEQEKVDLEKKLQAKLQQKAKLAATKTVVQKVSQAILPTVSAAGCGDNEYANYIYMHESGCRLTVRNAEGCVGIGQACPASKLTAVCPNLDYACQNGFFTSYAVGRYGSWQAAYNFWLANHWW